MGSIHVHSFIECETLSVKRGTRNGLILRSCIVDPDQFISREGSEFHVLGCEWHSASRCCLTTELSGRPRPLCRGQTRPPMPHGDLDPMVDGRTLTTTSRQSKSLVNSARLTRVT